MDKTQELTSQLFLLVRAQGALLSSLIKVLVENSTVSKEQITAYEKEITKKLDAISALAAQNKDVSESLELLNKYIYNEETFHVA